MQKNAFLNAQRKNLLMRFISLFLACFILTLVVFLAIAFVLNSSGDYRPLPPIYFVIGIAFFLAVFLFVPWGSFFFTAKEEIPTKILYEKPENSTEKESEKDDKNGSGSHVKKDDYLIEFTDKKPAKKSFFKVFFNGKKDGGKAIGKMLLGLNKKAPVTNKKTSANPDFGKAIKIACEFVLKTIATVKMWDINMDIYTRIAINLIVAGGCERMGSFFELSDSEYKKILEVAVKEVADNTFVPDAVRDKQFYKVLNGSLLEPEHRKLIAIGTRAMDIILREVKADAFADMREVLEDWRGKVISELLPLEGVQKKKTPLSIMFTDIVDSTMISEIKGEQFAQDILHVHNAIAREAIKEFKGREIKLMGDGVFACFNTALNGAKAAIQMQREIAKFNRENPDKMFYVRIGLNFGKPIIENGDLFGMAVGRASRVCHKAGGGAIFVTRDMYEELAQSEIEFKDEGEYEFKGIVQKERVYSIVWRK